MVPNYFKLFVWSVRKNFENHVELELHTAPKITFLGIVKVLRKVARMLIKEKD